MFIKIKVTEKEPKPLVELSTLYECIINTDCVESISAYKNSYMIRLKNNPTKYYTSEKEISVLLKALELVKQV